MFRICRYYTISLLFGALVRIAAARSSSIDCGLVLHIGRTYSVRNLVDVIPWVHPNGPTSRVDTHGFGDPKCINPLYIGWSKNDGLLFGRALEAAPTAPPCSAELALVNSFALIKIVFLQCNLSQNPLVFLRHRTHVSKKLSKFQKKNRTRKKL